VNNKTKAGAGAAVITASLFAFVTTWEGYSDEPYLDIVNVLTVCQGITGPDVIPGKKYSKAECDALLAKELTHHGEAVLICMKDPPQKVYEAAASLTYNIGITAFCHSTAVRRWNAGDRVGACDAFLMWNKAGGKPVKGLTLRREAERQLCLEGLKE
jgi:lysozyme